MKRLFLAMMLAMASLCAMQAQITAPAVETRTDTDAHYLRGAVPVVDGLAVITRQVDVNPSLTGQQLTETLDRWLTRCTNDERIHRSERLDPKVDNQLQQWVTLELTFSKNMFSHDFADLVYVLTLDTSQPGKVLMTMSHIAYRYSDGDKMVKYAAEDFIADPVALNKKGNIYIGYKKFRIKTIDLMDELAASLQKELQ